MSGTGLPRPFLKWAGGKTQLVDTLMAHMPGEHGVYHEPFLGGGAFFFKLFREKKCGRAILYDVNTELIDTYRALRNNVHDVIDVLSGYRHTKEFYYSLRSCDPAAMSLPEKAARMIFLNKTGYNGLYRVNKKGQFNVPFGRYKNPKYLDRDNLLAVSAALDTVRLVNTSFENVLDYANEGDIVYFDPPYVPVSATASFTSYHADGFTLQDQRKLRDVCIELSCRNVRIILSNSDTETVRNLFSSNCFIKNRVYANRAINCNGKKRGKTAELIITNFPVKTGLPRKPIASCPALQFPELFNAGAWN